MENQQRRQNLDDHLIREASKPRNPLRLENGHLIAGLSTKDGKGSIEIRNENDTDALVILTSLPSHQVYRAVFVLKESQLVLDKVAKGSYDVYVHAGLDWEVGKKRFKWEPKSFKFVEPLDVGDEPTGFSLMKVVGTEREDLSDEELPKL